MHGKRPAPRPQEVALALHNDGVGLYRDDGIVLRTQQLGEADRIVTVLARRTDSELLAASDIFIEAVFLLRGQNRFLYGPVGANADMVGATYIDRVH